MNAVKAPPQIQDIVEEIDRLIAEMTVLRSQVSALGSPPVQPDRSVLCHDPQSDRGTSLLN
jgi:hypothetical protein